MKKAYSPILSLLLIILTVACDDEPSDGGLTSINLFTFVEIIDRNGYLADPSGARVTLYSPDSIYSAVSDNNGRVILNNISSGVYNIKYSKPGYSNYFRYSERIIGGPADASLGSVELYELPTESISNLDINYYSSSSSCQISGKLTHFDGSSLAVRLFQSEYPDVSSTNYQTTSTFSINQFDIINDTEFSLIDNNLSGILYYEYVLGAEVYIRAYVTHINELEMNLFYTDITSNTLVYNALGTMGSNTTSLVNQW
jgi:hypothetical protein